MVEETDDNYQTILSPHLPIRDSFNHTVPSSGIGGTWPAGYRLSFR
jgi:hypothetical protein